MADQQLHPMLLVKLQNLTAIYLSHSSYAYVGTEFDTAAVLHIHTHTHTSMKTRHFCCIEGSQRYAKNWTYLHPLFSLTVPPPPSSLCATPKLFSISWICANSLIFIRAKPYSPSVSAAGVPLLILLLPLHLILIWFRLWFSYLAIVCNLRWLDA